MHHKENINLQVSSVKKLNKLTTVDVAWFTYSVKHIHLYKIEDDRHLISNITLGRKNPKMIGLSMTIGNQRIIRDKWPRL